MLYSMMAMSGDVRQMRTFGAVMRGMMQWMIDNATEAAEGFVEIMCSIKWRQYLTREEATGIVSGMIPAAPWSYDTWYRTMDDMQLEWEREGVFNRYALWVATNQIYTDLGENIAKIIGKPLTDIPADKIVPVVHDMAVSLLTDPDGKYCIREYHLS